MKLCKDQLAEKLVGLFGETDPMNIDGAVAQAKNEIARKVKQAKREDIEKLLDSQVKTLLDKGYPEAAGMEKDQFLGYVNPLRDKFETGDIIVIPERIVSIPKQMSMVKLNGKTGYTHLNLGVLRQADSVETPNVPYLIRDVENGAAMRNISPYSCVKQFKKQKRFSLTAEEGIALITHAPETLNDHYINLTGSRYVSDSVPSLWLIDGRPELDCDCADAAPSQWGSASCGSRIRA